MESKRMSQLDQVIIEIEKEYYDFIYEYYNDLILLYEENLDSIDITVKQYMSMEKQRTLYIPGYTNNHAYRRKQLFVRDNQFWRNRVETLTEYIMERQSVGIFGTQGDITVSQYMYELKRNALFYDVLVLNDPFYTYWSTEIENDYYPNIVLFYTNILYMWQIRKYLFDQEDNVFVVIFPFNSLISNKKRKEIADEAHEVGCAWIKEIFDISSHEKVIDSVEKLKKYSIKEIQEKLYVNGIYNSYLEAISYSLNMLDEPTRRGVENFCFKNFGTFDENYARYFLTLEALPNIATTNYFGYKSHTYIATQLKTNPIMERDEWAPVQREAKKQLFMASGNYMYTCAVHRNDKMGKLMELNDNEILQFHSRKQCNDFRDFFFRATKDIVYTYADADEIAEEVFAKIDELLEKEYNTILKNKKGVKKNAIIGFMKTALGFVPILSYAIAGWDISVSVRDYIRVLDDNESMIEYLGNRRKFKTKQ